MSDNTSRFTCKGQVVYNFSQHQYIYRVHCGGGILCG
ncbi:unnamed protein product [Staurois parvus]|uniref:Uncharacterized protein n=1 Tax=Staurois parvus TaxID=386267 RepID=A0ABN9C7G5_9NEOB|nr:unnamed protein product [Staurois parvus]